MIILIPTLVFWTSSPKSIFGQIWAKKIKVVYFAWKWTHRVWWGFWFLLGRYFSQFPTLNLFLGKFGPKKCLFLADLWFYFSPIAYTIAIWALCTLCCIYVLWACNVIEKKSKLFVLPESWQSISSIMILIPTLVFSISNPKSILGYIWSEKVKAICCTWKLAHIHTHRVSWGCWFLFWD